MSIKFWGIGAEGARLTGSQKVTGSNPVFSTTKGKKYKVRGKIIFTFYLLFFISFTF